MTIRMKVALVSAGAIVVAAIIGIYPAIRTSSDVSIGGIVVDQHTNQGIPQASIVIAGRAQQYVTEDSGNFKIVIPRESPRSVRLHVTKNGFLPLDMSVEVPAESLILQLRKQ